MISWLLRDLGSYWWVVLIVWVVIMALSIQWVAIWFGVSHRSRRLLADIESLQFAWTGGDLRNALRMTREAGLDLLLRQDHAARGEIRDHLVLALLVRRNLSDTCRNLLELAATTAPLCGLLGTVLGFFKALSIVGETAQAGSVFPLMAAPAALALKSTVACLIPTLLALLVPGILSTRAAEARVGNELVRLHDAILKRLRRRRRRRRPAAEAGQ